MQEMSAWLASNCASLMGVKGPDGNLRLPNPLGSQNSSNLPYVLRRLQVRCQVEWDAM